MSSMATTPEEQAALAKLCPALMANEATAPTIAKVESDLRVAMAWPEKGPLTVVDVAFSDSIPTYYVKSGDALGVVLRVALPGDAVDLLAAERRAVKLGYDRDLAPRMVSLGREDVLALRDLPGDLVETVRPTPLKDLALAILKVGQLPSAGLVEQSLVLEISAAVERQSTALGANAATLRQALGRLQLALEAAGAPVKVPCLRRIPPGSSYFDGDVVRFAQWRNLAKADPFEDFAQAANLVELRPEDANDFLGKLLHRKATKGDLARLAIYRVLATKVPNAESATADKLLPLVRLVSGDEWAGWVRDIPELPN